MLLLWLIFIVFGFFALFCFNIAYILLKAENTATAFGWTCAGLLLCAPHFIYIYATFTKKDKDPEENTSETQPVKFVPASFLPRILIIFGIALFIAILCGIIYG